MMGFVPKKKTKKKGVQIVVGTPGRVNDMVGRGALRLNKLKLFVLDEADEMLSRGFSEQVCCQSIPVFFRLTKMLLFFFFFFFFFFSSPDLSGFSIFTF